MEGAYLPCHPLIVKGFNHLKGKARIALQYLTVATTSPAVQILPLVHIKVHKPPTHQVFADDEKKHVCFQKDFLKNTQKIPLSAHMLMFIVQCEKNQEALICRLQEIFCEFTPRLHPRL